MPMFSDHPSGHPDGPDDDDLMTMRLSAKVVCKAPQCNVKWPECFVKAVQLLATVATVK